MQHVKLLNDINLKSHVYLPGKYMNNLDRNINKKSVMVITTQFLLSEPVCPKTKTSTMFLV